MQHDVEETFVVVWFPPYGDEKRTFKTEKAARDFVTRGDVRYHEVREWNPILTHVLKIVQTTETNLPLEDS